jgi:hypothetical protein
MAGSAGETGAGRLGRPAPGPPVSSMTVGGPARAWPPVHPAPPPQVLGVVPVGATVDPLSDTWLSPKEYT